MTKSMNANIHILIADLQNPIHQQAIVDLTNDYACDELAGGEPLPIEVQQNLIAGLQQHPTTLVFLAFDQDRAIGIATSFIGFSTFAAKPLINVHDLSVRAEYRGQGVGRALLNAVEQEARRRGCVKLTLEVLENNRRAIGLYESFGFAQAVYSPTSGGAMFFAKSLVK